MRWVFCELQMRGIAWEGNLYSKDVEGIRSFDFGGIAPRAKELDIDYPADADMEYVRSLMSTRRGVTLANAARVLGVSLSESNYERLRHGLAGLSNVRNYGVATWNEWSLKNWGTSWNACDTDEVDEDTVRFQTIGKAPLPIVEKLSVMYPERYIRLSYCEESVSFAGTVICKGGKVVYSKVYKAGGGNEDKLARYAYEYCCADIYINKGGECSCQEGKEGYNPINADTDDISCVDWVCVGGTPEVVEQGVRELQGSAGQVH